MPTKTEIIEAGARAVEALAESVTNWLGPTEEQCAEATLDAMLPLIKKQLVAEVRGGCVREVIAIHESHGAEAWRPVHKEHWPCMNELATQLIERFEL